MSGIVFFLEEPSAKAALEGLLPKILPEAVYCRFIVFEGKRDLERQLVRKMRGYCNPDVKFVVLRDKDASDCRVVKKALKAKCVEAGRADALVRIACHELESWFLADLAAVEQGLSLSGLAKKQGERRFSSPDNYPSPAQALKQMVRSYQKVGGARAIGRYLDPDNTRSHSFAVFVDGVRKLLIV